MALDFPGLLADLRAESDYLIAVLRGLAAEQWALPTLQRVGLSPIRFHIWRSSTIPRDWRLPMRSSSGWRLRR